MSTLLSYFLAFMHVVYPVANHAWAEPSDVTEARYAVLASDVAYGVSQPFVRPLFAVEGREAQEGAGGPEWALARARAKTGLVVLSVGRFESSYVGRVMDCAKAGDHGIAWGPFQTTKAKSRTCAGENYLGAVGVALEMMHESFAVLRGKAPEYLLAEYTDGPGWLTESAAKRSAARMGLALRYWKAHPYVPPVEDVSVASAP